MEGEKRKREKEQKERRSKLEFKEKKIKGGKEKFPVNKKTELRNGNFSGIEKGLRGDNQKEKGKYHWGEKFQEIEKRVNKGLRKQPKRQTGPNTEVGETDKHKTGEKKRRKKKYTRNKRGGMKKVKCREKGENRGII